MFLNNKYTKTYMLIIDSRKRMKRKRGNGVIYDSHHIIPKCMGGSNDKSNKVLLTPREHFIAHRLLIKMVDSPYKKSMYCAIVRFLGKNADRSLIKKNSRTYQHIIEQNRKHMSGVNNPFYGKTHSKETRDFISKFNKEYQLDNKNPFYGKEHTVETKKLLSELKSNPIRVYFENGNIEDFTQYKFLGTYLGMSEHLGCKICKPQYHYLLSKYKIIKIEKL
jgi:hypothetical protein